MIEFTSMERKPRHIGEIPLNKYQDNLDEYLSDATLSGEEDETRIEEEIEVIKNSSPRLSMSEVINN